MNMGTLYLSPYKILNHNTNASALNNPIAYKQNVPCPIVFNYSAWNNFLFTSHQNFYRYLDWSLR